MATPHVSAVAALVWSQNPAWSPQQIRDALAANAEDLGAPGRDDVYGFGLVQARPGTQPILSLCDYYYEGIFHFLYSLS